MERPITVSRYSFDFPTATRQHIIKRVPRSPAVVYWAEAELCESVRVGHKMSFVVWYEVRGVKVTAVYLDEAK